MYYLYTYKYVNVLVYTLNGTKDCRNIKKMEEIKE